MTKAKEPQVYSYYSFKGGVGRTMTLMNLAYALAMQGRHVLIVDMDLEAPGLSGFMTRHDPPEIKRLPRHDVIDLLIWAKDLVGDLPEGELLPHLGPYDWPVSSDYMARVPAEKLGKNDDTFLEPGRLDVVAIDESREYYERMARLDIPNFTRQMLINVGSLLRLWFKSRRVTVEFPDYYGPMPDDERYVPYDYVFVDSRTGITEVGGLCIGPMSDQLVVLCGLNDQNVEGTRMFLGQTAVLKPLATDPPEIAKPTIFVASPIPDGNPALKHKRLETFETRLGKTSGRLSYHPQLGLLETIFVRDFPDEPLTADYRRLLRCFDQRNEASEEVDLSDFLRIASREPPSRPLESRRAILKAAIEQRDRTLIGIALGNWDWSQLKDGADFQWLDRAFRLLLSEGEETTGQLLLSWAGMMELWSQQSSDEGFKTGRLEWRIECLIRAIEDPTLSRRMKTKACFDRGVTYGQLGDEELEIADYTAVIETPEAPSEFIARALFNRAVTYGLGGDADGEIADYTALIEMPNPPTDFLAKALFNRALTYGFRGETEGEIADYTSLIEMTSTPAEFLATAYFNRGLYFGEHGEADREVADYTALIEMPDAPAEFIARALINRGLVQGERGDTERKLADCSAVIAMRGATAAQKLQALFHRGHIYAQRGELECQLADYTAIIEMPEASAAQRASAFFIRALIYAQRYETDREIADYTAIIEILYVPAEKKAEALNHRGSSYSQRGEIDRAIADYTAVIEMPDAPRELKTKAFFDRGMVYRQLGNIAGAIADMTAVIEQLDASTEERLIALGTRGISYGQLGATTLAIADFTAVIEMPFAAEGHKAQALNCRSCEHFKLNSLSAAIADARAAIEIGNDSVACFANLAIACLADGQTDEAIAAYREALARATVEEFATLSKELDEALARFGELPGADEVRRKIEARKSELEKPTNADA